MSAIASFTKFSIKDIDSIINNTSIIIRGLIFKKRTDQFYEYKITYGKQLPDFEYSGWVYADLLNYIEENIVNLFNSKFKTLAEEVSKLRESTILIIDYDLAQSFIEKVKNRKFSPAELLKFHNDFAGTSDNEEYGNIMVKGIEHLVKILQLIDKDSVILFEIG